jgi:hypothetical protein
MRIQFVIDMLIFSLLYSQIPFALLDLFEKTGAIFSFEPVSRKYIRHIVISCVSPVLFLWASKSGLRNRYVIWHLERNIKYSGLNPIEVLCVPLYFCIYIIPLEYFVSYIDYTYPMPIHSSWSLHLLSRTSNTFLMSALYHLLLERSSFMDTYRLHYFLIDRDP